MDKNNYILVWNKLSAKSVSSKLCCGYSVS